MTTQQQRMGAQRAAAGRVREQQSRFDADLRRLGGEADALRADYQGPAADAFFLLVTRWLDDARAIVRDLEGFAGRLERQEDEVASEQEQDASTYQRAAARLAVTA